jgi:RNA polymerase sigma-70 factor (ECF subfamily)
LSFETGLSYTRLSSTIKTGSSQAYIQERQRIHYLGIPLHLGWQWYSKAHLSLYSSAGVMLEMPIRGTTDINHLSNGSSTFQKENSLNVPCQFSTTFGLGLQYDFTPHLGIYLEPSLQYFVDDGSDIKTYRTEHPFSITLPLGIRFRW